MKITIIIPIYNVSNFVKECIESALDQTYADIEYLIINDCTPDDSIEKIKAVLNNHNRKSSVEIIMHNNNKGLSGARNTGVLNATGDYLYFLDGDDKIPKNSIEILASLAKRYMPDFVIGNFEQLGSSFYIYPTLKLRNEYILGNKRIFSLFLNYQWYSMAWNKLINKDFFLQQKLFFHERIYHEDILWSFQMAIVTNSIAVSPLSTYYYRVGIDSIMGRKSLKHYNDMLFCCRGIINSNRYNDISVKTYLETILIMIVYDMFLNGFSKDEIYYKIVEIKKEFDLKLYFPISKRSLINLSKLPVFYLSKDLSYSYLKTFNKLLHIARKI